MPTVAERGLLHRLAQRDADRAGGDVDAVLHLQPVEQHLQVGLTHRPHHDLVGIGVDLDAQRGVLRREAAQALRELVLVGAGARRQRGRQQRLGHHPGLHQRRGGGVRQRVPGLGAGQPGDGHDLTSDAGVDRRERAAQHGRDGADPLVDVVVLMAALLPGESGEVAGHVHGGVGHQGPREDPHDADPADVRVRRRLHHLGRQRARRVARQGLARVAVRGGDGGGGVLQRGGEPADDDLEQLGRAEPGERVGDQHRVERAAGHRLLEVVDERVERDVLASEPAVEQAVVLGLLDDPLDQPLPGSLDELQVLGVGVPLHPGTPGVVEDPLGQQPDQARGRLLVAEQRQVQRLDARAEHALAHGEGLVEVRPLLVQVRDHHGSRHADGGALLPEHPGHPVDAVHGRDDEEGGIRRPQPRTHLPDEVGVTRGVHEGHPHPLVEHRRHGERDGAAQAVLDVLVVAHRGPVLDPAQAGDRTGAQQERLDQSCLSPGRVTDEHDVADPVGRDPHRLHARLRVSRHETSSCPPLVPTVWCGPNFYPRGAVGQGPGRTKRPPDACERAGGGTSPCLPARGPQPRAPDDR